MSDPLPQEAAKQIRAALAAGNKIEAIKIYRSFSGASLVEAKDFIEALAAGRAPVVPFRPEAAPGAIEDALFAGRKIAAIKLYREVHGGGLAEAKQRIEALEAQLRKSSPERFATKKGCLVFSAAFLLGAAGLIVAITG